MANAIPSDAKKFRTGILPMFLCSSILLYIFGNIGAACLIFFLDGHINLHVAWGIQLKVVEQCLIYSFAWTFISFCLYPVALSPAGIYGYSIWGRRDFIRWQQIASVRTFKFLNLQWFRIYSSESKKVVWVKKFSSSPVEFLTEIRRLAPANNPILNPLN